MAKAMLPPGPLKVFSASGTTAILDADGNEVVGWAGFDKSNRSKAEHKLLARELVRRFNAAAGAQEAGASGAVGETARTCEQLIDELEWAVLARSQGVPGSADKLHEAKQAIRNVLAGLPGTSNGQENGNG